MDLRYGAASVSQHGSYERVTYSELSTQESRAGKCLCGKRVRRTRTFTQTVSPFNKDPETGTPRTPRQVKEALSAEAKAWVPDFTCTSHEWAPLHLNVVGGGGAPFETVYQLGDRTSLSRARKAGAKAADGTDDFRLVLLDGDRLVAMTDANGEAFEWAPESYIEECLTVAERCGLRFEVTA